MVCVNALAFAAWGLDLYYLETHRPAAPDPAHGFVLRQQIAHSDRVYYASAQDSAVYYGLGALDIAVFAGSGLIAYFYARARERQRADA